MYNEAVLSRILIYSVVLALFSVVSTPVLAESTTVLVFPFENQTGDRNVDWLGEGLAELTLDHLQTQPNLYVFDRDERLAAYQANGIPEGVAVSRATALTLGWDLGADSIVTGSITGDHENFTIEARVIDLAGLRVSDDFKTTGKLDDVLQMEATLAAQMQKMFTGAAVAAAEPSIPRSAFENYIRALLTQDPRRRTELLQEAVRLHPAYSAAGYQLGHAHYLDRDFKASNQALEKIGSVEHEFRRSQFLRGLNDYNLGDFTAATNIFFALPPTYDVLLNLGASLAAQGDGAGALLAWKRASDRDPLDPDAVFNSGYWSLTRGDADGAVRSLEQFMKLEGRDGEALFLLGRAYEKVGRLDESSRLIAQATRLSPRVERWLTQPLPNLVRLSSEADPAELRLPLDASLWNEQRLMRRAGSRDVAAWLDAVQTQLDSQLYGEAIRQLLEIVKVFPMSVDARVQLAQVYEGQREYEKAMQAVQQALILDPANTEALALKQELERQLAAPRRRQ